jgi:hypothetical protein
VSALWRLAAGSAAAVVVFAAPAAVVVFRLIGEPAGWAFLYGIGVGLITFVSIALTVGLMTIRPTGPRVMWGTISYVGRLLFAAAAITVPVLLDLWPVLPMLGGFAGVYVIENVALLWAASRSVGGSATALRETGRSYGEAERRIEF